MSLVDDAQERLGELFIIGFKGLELMDETSAFLSQAKIGGVILFTANYDSPSQLSELTHQIQECRTEIPLWISVDQEGGRVQRFKKPFTKIPEAQAVGALQSPKITFEIAEVIAKELKAVGVNLNFCPVADILTNPSNPVIGSRSYGTTEDLVSKMVTATVRGHLMHGVQPCVKHFPGHGDTNLDSHLDLPRVETPIDVLKNREYKPFLKALKSRCSLIMTAHVLNSHLDPEFPATLSSKTLQDHFRKELRYPFLILSDDMEMKAITDHYGAEEAPRMAIQAGCDTLIYRTEGGARHAYTSLIKALEAGTLAPETILQASDRVRLIKRATLLPYRPIPITDASKAIGTPEHLTIVQKCSN